MALLSEVMKQRQYGAVGGRDKFSTMNPIESDLSQRVERFKEQTAYKTQQQAVQSEFNETQQRLNKQYEDEQRRVNFEHIVNTLSPLDVKYLDLYDLSNFQDLGEYQLKAEDLQSHLGLAYRVYQNEEGYATAIAPGSIYERSRLLNPQFSNYAKRLGEGPMANLAITKANKDISTRLQQERQFGQLTPYAPREQHYEELYQNPYYVNREEYWKKALGV